MSDTITTSGLITSFANTPQAKDDTFYSSLTGLTEDRTTTVILDVMANDLGGKAKVLYSLDDGTENEGSATSYDLLTRDATGADNFSRLGALIEVQADGKVAYTLTPAAMAALQSLGANEVTTDTFTYAIRLSSGALSWATVTVEIHGLNDKPTVTVTEVETGSVVEQTDGPGENSGILTTDGSFDFQDKDLSDSHTVQVALKSTEAPGNVALGELTAQISNASTGDGSGAVSWSFSVAAGALDFLAQGEVLNQVYTVTLNDGQGGTVTKDITIQLVGTNDVPELTGTRAGLTDGTEDTDYTVTLADLLAGFSDVDGDTLSVSDLTATDGSVTDNGDGTYTVSPSANFNGAVTLSYNVIDGNGGTVGANLGYTVAAVNDMPELTGTQAALDAGTEDVAYTVSQADLLAGFSDVDGDTLSVSDLTATDGSVTDNGDGTYTVSPSANFNGAVTLSYNVIDGNGGTVGANLGYTVAAVNDMPVITSGVLASVDENASASTVIYTATGTDVEDGGIATWSLSGADAAAFSIGADGALRLLAPADYETKSVYQVNVVATDGNSQSVSKALTIQVNDLAEAPPNAAPSVNLTSNSAAMNEIAGVVSTTSAAIALATINLVDDGSGVNTLALAGPDAGYFVISGGQLFLRSGVSLDYENKSIYSVTVTVNDASVGGNPDGSATFTLSLNNVAESEQNDNDTPTLTATGTSGTGGDDVLIGTSAGNTLSGANGDDTLSGLGGTDALNGGNQDDVLYGGAGNDTLVGGNHDDSLFGGSGDDTLTGDNQNDTLYGGSGNDTLNGSGNDDELFGGFGTDRLNGGGGNDTLRGSADSDTLSGGTGNDLLFGDGGADTFVWVLADAGSVATPALDTVQDFAAGDTLDIKDLLDNGLSVAVTQDGDGTTVSFSNASGLVQHIELAFYTAESAVDIQAKLVDDGRYSL